MNYRNSRSQAPAWERLELGCRLYFRRLEPPDLHSQAGAWERERNSYPADCCNVQ